MACRYEEEIFKRDGKVEECGCPTCPYKKPGECYEKKSLDLFFDEDLSQEKYLEKHYGKQNLEEWVEWGRKYV
jgi:hypothetical protein